MANERVTVVLIETGDLEDAFFIDAKEMVKSGAYAYAVPPAAPPAEEKTEDTSGEKDEDKGDTPADRDAVKDELLALGVVFNKSASTAILVKLLEAEKEKLSGQQ